MDLDTLLADLDLTASKGVKPVAAPAPQPTTPPPPPTNPATRAPPPGKAPAAPAVSFDDLQGLMDDLTSVTKSPGFPTPPRVF